MTLPGIDVDPGQGDPEGIRAYAQQFTDRASGLTARAQSARDALSAFAPITAQSVDALRVRVTTLAGKFDEGSAAATEVATILNEYASALDTLKADAATALAHAHDAYDAIWTRRSEAMNAASEFVTGWALGWDDVLPSWLYLDDRSYLTRWENAIDDFKTARTTFLAYQASREQLDSETAGRLNGIDLFTDLRESPSQSLSGTLGRATLWAGDLDGLTANDLAGLGDPDLVRASWGSLTPEQQAALIAAAPAVIGNLDGIPIRDRAAANQINIADEIQAREDAIADIEERRAAALANAYHSEDEINRIYDEMVAEEQRYIDSYQGLLDQEVEWVDETGVRHTDQGARVVVFDPDSDAIGTYYGPLDPATGDIPDWVRHVAVSVPGTGANMTDFSNSRGEDLYEAAGPNSAVFQWAGGAFPQSIPEATDASFSEALAPRLRDFTAGISVPQNADLTVLGHSYGGATVGLAEQAGLSADRILYVSAAGMGAGVEGLDDFPNTSDAPHYALMTRNDLVVGLIQGNHGDINAIHGQSPLTADGVIRLETGMIDATDLDSTDLENYNVEGNGTPAAIDGHSTVFQPGSTSFDNIIAVITGGEAEVFAEDEYVVDYSGQSPGYTIDGIDRSDYTPEYIEIE